MKIIIILIFLISNMSFAKSSRGNYIYPSTKFERTEDSLERESIKRYKAMDLLKTIKYKIINGEFEVARILLKESSLSPDFTRKVQLRYLAILEFISGNYQQVHTILSSKEMSSFKDQARFCTLNTLALLHMNKVAEVANQWPKCQQAASDKSDTSLFWLNTIVKLRTTSDPGQINKLFEDIFIENQTQDYFRIYLKLSLYLERPKAFSNRYQYLSQQVIQDVKYRELMGMNYYRGLEVVKAFKILEKLGGVNAEVFKGNLYLFEKKYDQAYAQYKIALKVKDNSPNALERLIPLAWKLGQWGDGIEYILKFKFKKKDLIKKYTLLAAFFTMRGEKAQTKKVLKYVERLTSLELPLEVSQLKVVNGIKYKEFYQTNLESYNACLKSDGLHCMLLMHLNNWDDPLERLNRNTKIHKKLGLIEKYTQKFTPNLLKEQVFVDQKIIEELDNNLISLTQY